MRGGEMCGQHLEPVTYIVAGLQARFAQLDDESRLAAMTQLLAFQRQHGESINAVLMRYDLVRQRARQEGNFVMSWEGCSLQLMRALNVSSQQMIQFLQPFGSRLPSTEAEFDQLTGQMRRVGHILEHSPNNIGQLMRSNSHMLNAMHKRVSFLLPMVPGMRSTIARASPHDRPVKMHFPYNSPIELPHFS